MQRYVVHRLLQGLVLLFLVAAVVFFLGRLTGNPVDLMLPEGSTPEDRATMIKALGLDGPLYQQFLIFIRNALHGDLGMSIRMREPAVDVFFSRLPNTLALMPWAILLAMALGIPLGVIAARSSCVASSGSIRSTGLPVSRPSTKTIVATMQSSTTPCISRRTM